MNSLTPESVGNKFRSIFQTVELDWFPGMGLGWCGLHSGHRFRQLLLFKIPGCMYLRRFAAPHHGHEQAAIFLGLAAQREE